MSKEAWLAWLEVENDGTIYSEKAKAACKVVNKTDVQHVLNRYEHFYPRYHCVCVNENESFELSNRDFDVIYLYPRGVIIVNHFARTFEWFDPRLLSPPPKHVQALATEGFQGVVSTKRSKHIPLGFVHATIVHQTSLADFLLDTPTYKLTQWFDFVRYPSPEYVFRLAAWDMMGVVSQVKWPMICKILAENEENVEYSQYLDDQLTESHLEFVDLDARETKELIREVYVPIAHAVSVANRKKFYESMPLKEFMEACSGNGGARFLLAHLLRNASTSQ